MIDHRFQKIRFDACECCAYCQEIVTKDIHYEDPSYHRVEYRYRCEHPERIGSRAIGNVCGSGCRQWKSLEMFAEPKEPQVRIVREDYRPPSAPKPPPPRQIRDTGCLVVFIVFAGALSVACTFVHYLI